jgi:DNA polymerase III epsilon subunit-like protein
VTLDQIKLSEADYVVLDLETTGFAPTRGDRVVEVALLRCRPGTGVVDRFATLVDPRRDVGPTRVHRLREHDVHGAPPFEALIPQLRRRLAGAVLVAHNLHFDLGFLHAEFSRAGTSLPDGPQVCTLRLVERLGVAIEDASLAGCCRALAVPFDNRKLHGASADAHAAAGLLLRLLRTAREHGLTTLADLGCSRRP